MSGILDPIILISEINSNLYYWIARTFYHSVATIQTGKVGEIGTVTKLKTKIFKTVIDEINDLKEEKLGKGYREIERSDLLEFTIIIVPKREHNFGEEFLHSELSDELDEINDDLNEELLKRGISIEHCAIFMEEDNEDTKGDIILKFLVLNKKLCEELVKNNFGDRIENVRRKIKNWS
jgi:predicted DNA-binding WGR domain protein